MSDRKLERDISEVANVLSSLRQQVSLVRLRHVLQRRYDPNQPRLPSGSEGGGRWRGGATGGSSRQHAETLPTTDRDKVSPHAGRFTLAARRRTDDCEIQYERDLFQCRIVRINNCYAQAMKRKSACENGQPIPPFNY